MILFFELIRIAIGSQDNLTRIPSESEWGELFELAKKQSLVGITFIGIQKMGADADDCLTSIGMSEDTYLAWMGLAAKIQQTNDVVNQRSIALQKNLSADGIRSSILKGQAVACLYGDLSVFRQSGDIDVYVDCGREKAIAYAKSKGQTNIKWDFKHLHLDAFEDTEVEMHYMPNLQTNLWRTMKLLRFWKEHVEEFLDGIESLSCGDIVVPSKRMHAFFILHHAYRHFTSEGLGLRQVMDCYFVLNQPLSVEDVAFILSGCKVAGMNRFLQALMWILHTQFGMSDDKLLCPLDDKEGQFLLNEIITSGNFGKHDKRLKASESGHRKADYVLRKMRHTIDLCLHYPSEVLWTPFYLVWHKCWKVVH